MRISSGMMGRVVDAGKLERRQVLVELGEEGTCYHHRPPDAEAEADVPDDPFATAGWR